jgi:hypothetical protein
LSNDLGHAAWSISGTAQSSQLGHVSGALSAAEKSLLSTQGFDVTATVRVVQGLAPAYDSTNFTTMAGFHYDDGSVRWEVDLGIDAAGDTVAILASSVSVYGAGATSTPGQNYTLVGSGSSYNSYDLHYDPTTETAGLFVNGIERLSGYTGQPDFVANQGLSFAAYSGGTANYSSVALTTSSASGQLAFAQQPVGTTAGSTLSRITVDIEDSGGAIVTGDTSNITLALAANSNGGALGGTTIVAAFNGVATFPNLSVSKAGTYNLIATDATDTSVTSTSFIITSSAVGTSATTSLLTSSANIFPVGDSCNLTCTVAPASGTGPAPTGTVTIEQNGIAKATETLSNGTVTFQWTAITAGPSALDNFVYNGDSNYATSTSNTIDQSYPALSQLSANITRAVIPSTNVAGQPLNARVPVSFQNTGSALPGTCTIVLYADTSTGGLSGSQVALQTTTRRTPLRANGILAATMIAKSLPASLPPGTYYLLVEVTDPLGNSNIVNTSQTIAVAAPFVSLAVNAATVRPATIAANRFGSVPITIVNNGNINATGVMTITLNLSPDQVTTAANFATVTTTVRINIRPGRSSNASVRFKIPAVLPAALYYPIIMVAADGVSASAIGSPFAAG